jgi:hypothetical protein
MGWGVADYLEPIRAVVAGAGDCLNVRARPSTDALVVGCVPDGTAVALEGPPASDGVFTWRRIAPSVGTETGGWVAGEYLE